MRHGVVSEQRIAFETLLAIELAKAENPASISNSSTKTDVVSFHNYLVDENDFF
jgi:hypothetical protein